MIRDTIFWVILKELHSKDQEYVQMTNLDSMGIFCGTGLIRIDTYITPGWVKLCGLSVFTVHGVIFDSNLLTMAD